MIVTILRHGEAGAARIDSARRLTPKGVDDISFAGQQFRNNCKTRAIATPDRLLYSRWLRTTETAELFAGAFKGCTSESEPALEPSGDVLGVTDKLLSVAQERSDGSSGPAHVLLVSHQPLVSHLAEYYLGVGHSVPSLPPGGLFTMTMDVPAQSGAMLLFWALPPHYHAGI